MDEMVTITALESENARNDDDRADSGVESAGSNSEVTAWLPNAVTGFFSGSTSTPSDQVADENEPITGETTSRFQAGVQRTAEIVARDLEGVSRDMSKNLSLVGEELNRGWSGLNRLIDGVLSTDQTDRSAPNDPAESEGKSVQTIFAELFPQLKDEDVVDSFSCMLVQKYRCYLNNSTPEKSFPFGGRLFVTVQHAAFWAQHDAEDFGRANFPVIIDFQQVDKVQKGQNGMLRLLLKSKASYVFTYFANESDFSGALSLLEHIWEGANAEPSASAATDSMPKIEPAEKTPSSSDKSEKTPSSFNKNDKTSTSSNKNETRQTSSSKDERAPTSSSKTEKVSSSKSEKAPSPSEKDESIVADSSS